MTYGLVDMLSAKPLMLVILKGRQMHPILDGECLIAVGLLGGTKKKLHEFIGISNNITWEYSCISYGSSHVTTYFLNEKVLKVHRNSYADTRLH